jgi:DNA-directed RNA polymerase subunit RPC12/RpoP
MTENELRTRSDQYNAATAVTMGYQEIRNSAENWQGIMKAFAEGRAKDLNEEPKKLLAPVVLTGSGPSLDKAIPKLKEWKGAIICHYSQALTLMYHGIIPDYIVCLDAICNWEGLKGVDWASTKTKLVLHPGMWPSMVANWPNEMLFYRQNLGKPDTFGTNEQKIMFCERQGTLQDALDSKISFRPMIQTELTMFACTPPAQLFVAQVLQYGPVFLTGVDFCYINDKERFTNWELIDETVEIGNAPPVATQKWVERVRMLEDPNREYIMTANGLKTDPLHMYYKKNFISACRLSMQRVFSTDKGAITEKEMPFIELDKVIKNNGRKAPDISPEARAKAYERYLARINCFVVNFAAGDAFVEVGNPIPDLTSFMNNKNREYKCDSCGASVNGNTDADGTGVECPACHKGKIARVNPCDVKANLNRFQALLDYIKEVP